MLEATPPLDPGTGSVGELTEATQAQRHALVATNVILRKIKLLNVVLVVLVVLVGVLSGAEFVMIRSLSSTNQTVQDNQDKIEAIQDRTSNKVLCPLYSLLIEFEPRVMANKTLSTEDRDSQTRLYVVIHQGYTTLGCRT